MLKEEFVLLSELFKLEGLMVAGLALNPDWSIFVQLLPGFFLNLLFIKERGLFVLEEVNVVDLHVVLSKQVVHPVLVVNFLGLLPKRIERS